MTKNPRAHWGAGIESPLSGDQSAMARRQLIEDTLLPQAHASFQSALASYQVGSVDFESLLLALRESRNAQLMSVDARRDELIAAS